MDRRSFPQGPPGAAVAASIASQGIGRVQPSPAGGGVHGAVPGMTLVAPRMEEPAT